MAGSIQIFASRMGRLGTSRVLQAQETCGVAETQGEDVSAVEILSCISCRCAV
jgi:hypothetical protein